MRGFGVFTTIALLIAGCGGGGGHGDPNPVQPTSTPAPAVTATPKVTAPMPGKVLDVVVTVGQRVAAGDPLVVLEAMKMETVASAESAGVVTRVHVSVGAMVEPGQLLVELDPS